MDICDGDPANASAGTRHRDPPGRAGHRERLTDALRRPGVLLSAGRFNVYIVICLLYRYLLSPEDVEVYLSVGTPSLIRPLSLSLSLSLSFSLSLALLFGRFVEAPPSSVVRSIPSASVGSLYR